MVDPVQYAYDKDGYAIIDNFFFDDVCDELHSLAEITKTLMMCMLMTGIIQ